MTTIQNTADATADSVRIMSRLAALRPAAATASAATVRLSEVAEAEMVKMYDSTNKTPALNATLDTFKEYHIAAAAGNEANDIAHHVGVVYGGYSKAAAAYNAAALVANMAMAAAVEKRGIAEAKVADCNSGGLFEQCCETTLTAAQADKLRVTEKAVADANEATVKANEAMAKASEAAVAKDKWAEIIACYDLDAIESLTQAIRADARTACSTPTVARFDPKLKAAAGAGAAAGGSLMKQ